MMQRDLLSRAGTLAMLAAHVMQRQQQQGASGPIMLHKGRRCAFYINQVYDSATNKLAVPHPSH